LLLPLSVAAAAVAGEVRVAATDFVDGVVAKSVAVLAADRTRTPAASGRKEEEEGEDGVGLEPKAKKAARGELRKKKAVNSRNNLAI